MYATVDWVDWRKLNFFLKKNFAWGIKIKRIIIAIRKYDNDDPLNYLRRPVPCFIRRCG
jgi:hypothetical protein